MVRKARITVGVALAVLAAGAGAAWAFDSSYEARNYAKIEERAAHDYTPAFNAELVARGQANEQQGAEILSADGSSKPNGRDPAGNLCFHHGNGCAGDIRLYDWGRKGYGEVRPILFTQRNGATLSGHVWMTRAGPARRPGIVITNGSIQAPEQLYWWAAQTLAEDGYIVLTFDPQGQGYSDTPGAGVDHNDGVPSQSGAPFFFGTEDALGFFFSTPRHPYVPRRSCSTGTSHAAKQRARVRAGLDSAYNPFWRYLDRSRVGLAGHSLGAAAVSYVGQLDPRVKAIVAWDNLSDVTSPHNLSAFGAKISCPSGSSHWPATLKPTKPALGMSDDYGLTPTPFTPTSVPDPKSKNTASLKLSHLGVPSGELNVRGGTHYEFSYIPNQGFGATLRGIDMADWYTLAWFDRYLKRDPSADARLGTNRWRADAGERAVDDQSPPDGNLFSTYLTSRLDFRTRSRASFDCESLRAGCAAMRADGWPANFSFLRFADRRDAGGRSPDATTAAAGSTGAPPAANSYPCGVAPSVRVRSLHGSRSGVRLSGRAVPGSCRHESADDRRLERIASVRVVIFRGVGRGRCRFVSAWGRLGAVRACRRPVFLNARGKGRWRLRVAGRVASGRYGVRVVALDVAGDGRAVRRKLRVR